MMLQIPVPQLPQAFEKAQYRSVELFGSLQRRKMTHSVQIYKCRIRDGASEVFGVLPLDEFVMLAVRHGNRHPNLRQFLGGTIWLGAHHDAHRIKKWFELIRGG